MKPLFNLIYKMGRKLSVNSGKTKNEAVDHRDISQREDDIKKIPLEADLEENLRRFDEITGKSYDISVMRILAGPESVPAAVLFIDGMVDKDSLASLLRIVELDTFKTGIKNLNKKEIFKTLKTRMLTLELQEVNDMSALYEGLSLGYTVILFDGTARALLLETRGWDVRNIMEPESETTIRGSRDGFVENIRTNTSLIRRRIRSPNLWMESVQLGSLTNTKVVFAYIKGLAGEEMLEELRSRLKRIDTDAVLESGVVEGIYSG